MGKWDINRENTKSMKGTKGMKNEKVGKVDVVVGGAVVVRLVV